MTDRFEQKLDALTTLVTNGFSAIAEDLSEQRHDLTTLKREVSELRHEVALRPTTQQVEAIVDAKLLPIIQELRSIRRDIDDLRQRLDNSAGLTKEIDHVLARVVAIEAHLGIKPAAA